MGWVGDVGIELTLSESRIVYTCDFLFNIKRISTSKRSASPFHFPNNVQLQLPSPPVTLLVFPKTFPPRHPAALASSPSHQVLVCANNFLAKVELEDPGRGGEAQRPHGSSHSICNCRDGLLGTCYLNTQMIWLLLYVQS